MKYLLVIVFFAVPILTFSQPSMSVLNEPVKADFSGRQCRKTHGLCSLNPTTKASEYNGFVNYDKDGNLALHIIRNAISKTLEIQILRMPIENLSSLDNVYLSVEADFILNQTLTSKVLKGTSKSKIKQGNYPIKITDTHFIITFKLE